MNRKFVIVRKAYIPPRAVFEEIEADELDMLLAGSDHSGNNPDFDDPDPDNTDPDPFSGTGGHSLNLDFSSDFVINDNTEM